tara:strand:- start:2198 stop:2551 length:354 start_codon:yes stop_codon:yes gene_type:complete
MDPKVIAAMVALVIGLVITIGVVAAAVNDGDKAKEEMMIHLYNPPPPPSPAPLSPSPPSLPPPSPPPLPPPSSPPTSRRLSSYEKWQSGGNPTFPITDTEKRDLFADLAKRRATTAR